MAERCEGDVRAVDLQSQVAHEVQSHHLGASLRPPDRRDRRFAPGFALRSHPLGSLPASQSPSLEEAPCHHLPAQPRHPRCPSSPPPRPSRDPAAGGVHGRSRDADPPTPSHGRRPAFARLYDGRTRRGHRAAMPPRPARTVRAFSLARQTWLRRGVGGRRLAAHAGRRETDRAVRRIRWRLQRSCRETITGDVEMTSTAPRRSRRGRDTRIAPGTSSATACASSGRSTGRRAHAVLPARLAGRALPGVEVTDPLLRRHAHVITMDARATAARTARWTPRPMPTRSTSGTSSRCSTRPAPNARSSWAGRSARTGRSSRPRCTPIA